MSRLWYVIFALGGVWFVFSMLTGVRSEATTHALISALTQIILVGGVLLLYRWWTNLGKPRSAKRSREEIIEQLRVMVADTNTAAERRDWAAERLAKLESTVRPG